MKTKLLPIALCVISLAGLGVLIYNLRSSPSRPTAADEFQVRPDARAIADELEKPRFELPPRPEHALDIEQVEATEPDSSSPSSERRQSAQAIVQLRAVAFDIAEFTATRLPTSAAALSLLGKLHLRNSNPDAAREIWDHAIALDANAAEPHIDYGHLELNLGNVAAAETHFRDALQRSPELTDAYPPLVEVLVTQSKFDEAIGFAQKWLSREPQSVKALCQLGVSYQQLGQFDAAVDHYSKALHIDPQSREAAMGLLTAYRSQGDREKTAQAAKQLEELNASDPRVFAERNVLGRDRVKMKDLLIFTTQRATQLLAQSGAMPAAIAQLEKANDLLPEPQPLRGQLAGLYVSQGRYDKALKLLREPCDRDPQDVEAWLDLALMSMQIRQLDAADEALQRIISLRPDDPQAYFLRAQTQMAQQRDVPGAVASARRALELSPEAAKHYLLGTTLYHAKDFEAAKAQLRQAIAMEPDNAEYRRALAEIP